MTYSTREEWLTAAADHLNDMIAERTDLKPSKRIMVAAGWPRRDRGGKVIGQCFTKGSSKGVHHLFISPRLSDRITVLDTLLHELVHAADDCQHGHKGPFVKACNALGLVGKPTANSAGPELKKELQALAKALGPYPHSALTPSNLPKQTTRMLKVECPDCGCIIRMTAKWLDTTGAPTCACGTRMEAAA